MNNLKILVVEDDPGSMLTLESALSELGYKEIYTADNSDTALEIITTQHPDILILDIDIKGELSGIDIAAKVQPKGIPVIFITGFDESEIHQQAKKTNPQAYLIKPFNILTLETALDNVSQAMADSIALSSKQEVEDNMILKDSLFVKNGSVLQKVKFKDIHYVQSEGNYSILHTEHKKYAIRISLARLIQRLPADIFVRTHQRYLVQTELVDKIDTFNAQIFVQGKSIPLGRTYKDDLLDLLNKI